jgi:nitroimidazol reductase NimA-like FMN-containing flavoprotein (pyridoxamine 5'-phosphate oxidase superfamily)
VVEMDGDEIDAFLAAPRLCHFATVDSKGRPRVRPLWYLWKDGEFWFTTRLRKRLTGRDVAGGSSVAVSIASETRPYRAVVAHGRPDVVDRNLEMLLAISTRYGEAPGKRWTAMAMRESDRILYRMRPDRLFSWDYGKRG